METKTKALALFSAFAIILAALTLFLPMTTRKSTLEQVLARETVGYFAEVALGAGCGANAALNEELAKRMYYSGGMICQQILGDTLTREMSGQGFCNITDKRCLFTQAYAQTSFRALGRKFQTAEEIEAFQQEIDQAYEKINSTKEKQ